MFCRKCQKKLLWKKKKLLTLTLKIQFFGEAAEVTDALGSWAERWLTVTSAIDRVGSLPLFVLRPQRLVALALCLHPRVR
jgi:hypothetical protein